MDVVNNIEFSNQTIHDEKLGLGTVQKAGLGIFFTFALIGIVSNTAMIQVYKKKDLKVRFNCLMLALAGLCFVQETGSFAIIRRFQNVC